MRDGVDGEGGRELSEGRWERDGGGGGTCAEHARPDSHRAGHKLSAATSGRLPTYASS